MQLIKWTERKFHFGYEKGYVPLFIERLHSTMPRMEELLTGCSEENASAKDGDVWSVKEHIGHLSDLEYLHDKRIDDIIEGKVILSAADMSNRRTYDANHNSKPVAQLLAEFNDNRNRFTGRILSLDEKYFEVQALHPRLQQMVTITDLLFFMAEHDVQHMAHIARLCAAKG